MPIKIATWNTNSIIIRLQHTIDVMNDYELDILGIQETKTIDNNFPIEAFHEAGFHVLFNGQKSYNGSAYISRKPLQNAFHHLPGMQTDYQRRFLQADYHDTTLINCYVPNGKAVGDEKYQYKLKWLDALIMYLTTLTEQARKIILMGDFNIAPEDRDLYDADEWRDNILCSPAERDRFNQIKALGFTDTFRKFNDKDEQFSWWDYREGAFQRNKGHRIDLILTTENILSSCTDCIIEKKPRGWERPSDHTPVIATFEYL
ncbi:MAG: exodeoxyribonuclease III [Ostreibacterium sp.]